MRLEYFNIAIKNLLHRRMRSWLTLLGIIIGVSAIIALLSLTQGLDDALNSQFDTLGSDMIMVMPGSSFSSDPAGVSTFGDDELDALERISQARIVTPIYYNVVKVEFKDESQYVNIIAMEPESFDKEWGDLELMSVEKGRYIVEGEDSSVMVGSRIAYDMFSEEVRLKNKLALDGEDFRVIGIMNEVGNPEDDRNLYMSLSAAQELFDAKGEITMFYLHPKEGVEVTELSEEIEDVLEDVRDEKDFSVVTTVQLIQQVNSLLDIVQIVLISISGISILVGAIGISNTMFTSVLERTNDIGIMKAVGATNRDIASVFIFESSLLGFVGGVLGVVIGLGTAYGINEIIIASGYSIVYLTLNPFIIAGGILFSVGVSAAAGAAPSFRAAKLRPIESLRYD